MSKKDSDNLETTESKNTKDITKAEKDLIEESTETEENSANKETTIEQEVIPTEEEDNFLEEETTIEQEVIPTEEEDNFLEEETTIEQEIIHTEEEDNFLEEETTIEEEVVATEEEDNFLEEETTIEEEVVATEEEDNFLEEETTIEEEVIPTEEVVATEEEVEEKKLSEMSPEELLAMYADEIQQENEEVKQELVEEELLSADNNKKKKEFSNLFIPEKNNFLIRNLIELKGLTYEETIDEAKKIGKPIIDFLVLKNYLNPKEILSFFHEETGLTIISNLIDLNLVEEKTFYKIYDEKIIVIYYPFEELIKSLKNRFPNHDIRLTSIDLFQIKSSKKESKEGLKTEFEAIIQEALRLNVSDIHMEVKEYGMEIKFRIMGSMKLMETISLSKANAMQKYIKDLASKYTKASNYDTETWEAGQDARIELEDYKIGLRLALTPSLVEGLQNNVMRILKTEGSVKQHEAQDVMVSMGYLREDVVEFQKWIKKPKGIILVTGSTGSGKSKMLNTIIASVPASEKIVTAEDPVEYKIPAATQHQVFKKEMPDKTIDMSFLAYIRSFMRQDPDIIFIGEWRKEKELTEAIVYASNTGHLVLTSLHSSSNAVIPGLLVNDYGLERTDVANNAIGFINQALIKKVCTKCRIKGVLDQEKLEKLNEEVHREDYKEIMKELLLDKEVYFTGEGCDKCTIYNNKHEIISYGYEGRMATYEWLFVDEVIQDTILTNLSVIEMNKVIKHKVANGTAKRYIDVLIYKLLDHQMDYEEFHAFLKGI